MKPSIKLIVNKQQQTVNVEPYESLNDVLRVTLGLTGTKRGCDTGGCGACTVLIDGDPIYSCMMPVMKAEGKSITTIEGLAQDGKLDPLQEAMVTLGGIQCGFCSPGIIMSARALLASNPTPNEDDVREALAGNLCRCTGYVKIIEAIFSAAKTARETG
ncbi:MAG: (2Fe-2S)-binding protein [Candidatus Bathyarchaeia archaeon]